MISIADDKPFRRYVTAIVVTFFASCICTEININNNKYFVDRSVGQQ